MNVQETILPQARRLRVSPELSPEARRRLHWMDYHQAHGRSVAQTCRHFDLSRQTFYRWWRRYDPRRPLSLEDDRGTRRPPARATAEHFLRHELPRMGFPIRAI